MASKAAMDAISAKLTAVWSSVNPSGPAPILPNTQMDAPDPKSVFLTLTFPISEETMETTGNPGGNVFREEGAFRVVLAVPVGEGLDPWAGYLDQIRAGMRAKVFNGVTTFEASPSAQSPAEDGEAHFFLSTAITYKYDVFG